MESGQESTYFRGDNNDATVNMNGHRGQYEMTDANMQDGEGRDHYSKIPPARLPPISNAPVGTSKVGVQNDAFEDDAFGKYRNERSSERPNSGRPKKSGAEEEEKPEKKPLAFCKFIVRRPKTAFGLAIGVHILFEVISVILILADYDLFPADFTQVPLNEIEDDTYLRNLAWVYRNEDQNLLLANTSSSVLGARTKTGDTLQLMFQASNVLTAARMQALEAIEQELTSKPDWQKFCKMENSACALPTSLLRFFDGSLDPDLNDTTYSDISGTLYRASQKANLLPILESLIGKGTALSPTDSSASLIRSIFYMGTPLEGYDLTTDSLKDQMDVIQDFQVDNFENILIDYEENGVSGMKVNYYSAQIFSYTVTKQVIYDLLLAAGSFTFIYLFMLFQTRSLLLTTLAIVSILTSFVGTNLLYRIVLDFRFFGIFHVLSIFIILGIGADNIFVFYDTWRATGREHHSTLEHRLSACYRRASASMAITSLTTFTAFVANAFSPLLGVSSFGLFSAVLVFVNFLSAVLYFPTVVIIHHLHWAEWDWPCFKPCAAIRACPCSNEDGEDKPNAVVRFFNGPYHKAVTHKWIRWVFIVCCAGVIGFFIYYVTKVTPSAKQVQIYRSGNNFQDALDLNSDSFKRTLNDNNVKVIIAFGMKNQDLSDCHKTDSDCEGKTVWDESFDLNPKPSQTALMEMCEKIRTMPLSEHQDLLFLRLPNDEVDITCFITVLDDYMKNDGLTKYTPTLDLSLPTSEKKLDGFFTNHVALYNSTIVEGENFYRYFETAKSYWLNNGYQGPLTKDYRTYSVLMGETRDLRDTSPILSDPEKMYGTRMRYAGIEIKTTLVDGTRTFQDGLDIYRAWEDFITDEIAKLPPSLQGGFQFTPGQNSWHAFKVQETLAKTALQGILIGISLAFVVLTIATTNIIISFMATVTITCVTVTVAGCIPLFGWEMSVVESVNLSLVVGLSVDYVVHLSESYHSSKQKDRVFKVKDMLRAMGVSVVSGAFSTLGASAFMMAAQIQFFFQFGIFIFCTIAFSLLYSLCLFTPMLGLLGPEGNIGSIVPLEKWVWYKIIGRNKDDVNCKTCKGKGFHNQDKEL